MNWPMPPPSPSSFGLGSYNPRVYLLAFSQWFWFSQSDIDFLDSRPEVMNWLTFSSSVLIVSQHTAYHLAAIFRERYPERHFIVTQVVPGDNDGWLPQEVWDFINNPTPGQGNGPKFPGLDALLNLGRR